MNMSYRMAVPIAVLLAAGAPAQAATAIADAEKVPEFSIIDVDDDGAISRTEAEAVPEILRIFAMVDKNRDDQLNTSEWSEAIARTRGRG